MLDAMSYHITSCYIAAYYITQHNSHHVMSQKSNQTVHHLKTQ
jgi:hypothetical protein